MTIFQRKLFFLVIIIGGALSASTHAFDQPALHIYVLALAAGYESQAHCSGMESDRIGLSFLLDEAKRDHISDAIVDAEIKRTKIDVETAIRDNGEAEWCASAWRLFGPNGLHAIRRK